MSATFRFLRRIGVTFLGTVLILLGVVMLVTPGPGILAILAGLAVLGTEFERPKRWLLALRNHLKKTDAEEPQSSSPPMHSATSE